MSKTKTRPQPSRGGLVVVFASIAFCALLTFGLSGVPGAPVDRPAPEETGAAPAFLNGMSVVMSELSEASISGEFLKGLEKPGSRYWTAFASPEAPASARSAAARYLARHGRSSALETLVPLLGDEESSVGREAQSAVAAVMTRHADNWTWTRLGTILRRRSTTDLARTRAVKVISDLGAPEGQKIVVDMLDREGMAQASALPALARLTLDAESELDSASVSEKVRELLQSEDPVVRRESALVLGQLGDVQSVETLVDMLDDENRGVRGNAHHALGKTTGLQLPDDSERWTIWLTQERDWYESQGEALIEDLESGTTPRIAAAIRSFSGHPLFREEVRELIEDHVFHDDAAIRRVACVALGRMMSRQSGAILVVALDDEADGVRQAAHDALKRVTGKELPADSDAWESVVRMR